MENPPLLSMKKFFHSKPYQIDLFIDEKKLKIQIFESSNNWIGEYSINFIENLTFKAGSSKKFNIFLNMLISALENTSSAVIIDLETHNDLEKMRNKPVLGNTNTIYLILTYLSEFDKVYYPLPLQLKVEDNQLIGHFQKEIFELNNNLNLIIKEKEELFEENNKLKSEFLMMNRLIEKENSEKEKIRKELENLENNNGKEIKSLKNTVEDLQNKLKTGSFDKTDAFNALQQENTRVVLENKILAAEVRKLSSLNKKKDERIEELQRIVEEHKELGKERSKSVYCTEEKVALKVSNASTRSRSTVKYVNTTDISAKLEKIVNLLAFNEKN